MKILEQFQPMQTVAPVGFQRINTPIILNDVQFVRKDTIIRNVRMNIVQSIRAFHAKDLQSAAAQLSHHFLYANLALAHTRQDILESIGEQFLLPSHYGKNLDALYDCMTDPIEKSGSQTGFVIVLERIPVTSKFDKEAREQLLDIFRDTADYWAERDVPFRCFYSFA